MAKRISWFCCDSEMPSDPRLATLPDNDHRWAWLCLLGLEKQGKLEGQDVSGFSHYCQIEHQKFIEILDRFLVDNMVDASFRPIGFEEWQQAALKAERNKRSYRKAKERADSVGSQSVVSRQSAQVSLSETETETKKEGRGGAREAVDNSGAVDNSHERPKESPPSDAQMSRAREMAAERGTTVVQVCDDLGFDDLSKENFTAVKNHILSLKSPTKDDDRKKLMEAKAAAYDLLRVELVNVGDTDGPDAAMVFIREQDHKAHGFLWGHFTKLYPGVITKEATA